MKANKNIVTGIMMTFLFCMITANMVAQKSNQTTRVAGINHEQVPTPPPNAPAPPPPPPPPPPPSPAPDMQGIPSPPQLDLPDLTSEQQEKIQQAGLERMKMMTPLHNQVREKKARLQTILTTTPFDGKAADQVAEELGKVETAILKEMIRHDQELRKLLTPQQQVLFDARPKPFLHRGR